MVVGVVFILRHFCSIQLSFELVLAHSFLLVAQPTGGSRDPNVPVARPTEGDIFFLLHGRLVEAVTPAEDNGAATALFN